MSAAKERPILFSGPMVRAILDCLKTQTRRVVRDAGPHVLYWDQDNEGKPVGPDMWRAADGFTIGWARCPYGAPGDRLWVRESWNLTRLACDADDEIAWAAPLPSADPRGARLTDDWTTGYAADGAPGPWRPSIHMPRWASRITLEVTEVRVQRLQEISEEDARAEGAPARANGVDDASAFGMTHATGFFQLWDSINGERAPWASNPWVWAVSFRRLL